MADEPAVILISGASRGLGRYLAEHFSQQGALVLGCSRGTSSYDNQNYRHFQVDISREDQVHELFVQVRKTYGRLDVLVNNAAINPAVSLFMAVPTATIVKSFETNVLGSMLMCRGAIRLMMARRFGRLINMGSMAVRLEVAGETVYTAMKAALVAYTRVLAKEVYPYGITCNVVAPSALPTEMSAQIDRDALAEVLKRTAIPHMGAFEDVAGTIEYLIRPESKAVTGQVLYLGGV
jgi:3-oxoacyl-[acyl-carrier protein] reductase